MLKEKQDILLLHGALGSSKIFDSLIPLLSTKFNCHTFDFAGHGIHINDTEIYFDALCNQIIEYIDTKKLTSISVFGYSMGGYIGLYTSIKSPNLIDKIIALGTKLDWDENIASREIKQIDLLSNLPQEHPFIQQLINLHGQNSFQNCFVSIKNLMHELGKRKPLNTHILKLIQSKVLFIIGDLDTMVSLEETQKISTQIKHAELICLPETKHPFERVNQLLLSQTIEKFLVK